MAEVLALIPARGGSKGIPQKNIVHLGGRPLIDYVISAARDSIQVNRIVVTTDNEDIADAARNAGAEVPFIRPAPMAEDRSPVMPALSHALEWLNKHEGYQADIVVMIQPTSPFTETEQINQAVDKLLSNQDIDAVTTIVELDHVHHPYNIREINSDGLIDFWKHDEHYLYPTRQEKPKFFSFGNLYAVRYPVLLSGSLYGNRCLPLIIDRISAFDINSPDDLVMAESIINVMKRQSTT